MVGVAGAESNHASFFLISVECSMTIPFTRRMPVFDLILYSRVHCIWDDSYAGSKLVNVTLLPALLSSSNLHYVAAVHKLRSANSVQVQCP